MKRRHAELVSLQQSHEDGSEGDDVEYSTEEDEEDIQVSGRKALLKKRNLEDVVVPDIKQNVAEKNQDKSQYKQRVLMITSRGIDYR
jgi:SepF-like predicted cell division protein (DUF552 family)